MMVVVVVVIPLAEEDVHGVDDAGQEAEARERDVDQEVARAARVGQHAQRRADDGQDDLAALALAHCGQWSVRDR